LLDLPAHRGIDRAVADLLVIEKWKLKA
jgi:hypothetical protein